MRILCECKKGVKLKHFTTKNTNNVLVRIMVYTYFYNPQACVLTGGPGESLRV